MRSPTNGMTAIGPPWSEITALRPEHGEIKWRVPDGGVTAPPEAGLKPETGAHMPRGGPLVTAGGLVFVATASDRTVRAYDRDSGKVVWTTDLPTGSEGVPATYEVGGRQFIVFPVAAELDCSRRASEVPAAAASGGAAAGGGPEAEAAGAAAEVEQVDRRRHPGCTSHTRCRNESEEVHADSGRGRHSRDRCVGTGTILDRAESDRSRRLART